LEIFELLEKPLEGFHIVVDAGNGAGGFFAVSHIVIYLAFFCLYKTLLYLTVAKSILDVPLMLPSNKLSEHHCLHQHLTKFLKFSLSRLGRHNQQHICSYFAKELPSISITQPFHHLVF
jgi:hypothetical protein